MSLPKSLRLKRWGEFSAVREGGKSYASRHLVLGVLPEIGASTFRYGFITSKRVGGAVERNRIRRRLRAIARAQNGALVGGGMLVTIARHRASTASYEQLAREWQSLAKSAGLFGQPGVEGKR